MSLVGTLDEMGLADLFQLFGLSRKSGVLRLNSKSDWGCIVFRDGRIGGAAVRGGPRGLRAVLLEGGLLTARDFERAHEYARCHRVSVAEAVVELFGHSFERIESLCRETVQSAVLTMLDWSEADFHFASRSEPGDRGPEILTPAGIDPQFLAMESARRHDERAQAEARPGDRLPSATLPDDGPHLSELNFEPRWAPDWDKELRPERVSSEPPEAEISDLPVGSEDSGVPRSSLATGRVLILVDDDLACMEWIKRTLLGDFDSIHIFQQTDQALARIRQYLVRGTHPMVLICPDVSLDWLGGYHDMQGFVGRLKAQSSRVQVYWLLPEGRKGEAGVEKVDGVVVRPSSALFGGRSQAREWEVLAQQLRKCLGGEVG